MATQSNLRPKLVLDFKRITYKADGNNNDGDDVSATPLSLALLAEKAQ